MIIADLLKAPAAWLKRYLEEGAGLMIAGLFFTIIFMLCILSASKLSEFATLLAGLGQFAVAFLLWRLTTRQYQLSKQIADRESKMDERQYRLEMYDRRRAFFQNHGEEIKRLIVLDAPMPVLDSLRKLAIDVQNLFGVEAAATFGIEVDALLNHAEARAARLRFPRNEWQRLTDQQRQIQTDTIKKLENDAYEGLLKVQDAQNVFEHSMKQVMSLEYR